MTAPEHSSAPTARLAVVEVDAATDPRWDAFVAAHPDGFVYHHSTWLRVLEREYERPVIALAVEGSDGRIMGVLPLVRTRGLPLGLSLAGHVTKARLTSLPRTPIAGPLALDANAAAALIRAAVERVRAEQGVQLQLKTPGRDFDGMVEGVAAVPWRESYVVALRANPDELRFGNSRNHSRIRWAVNKAERQGVVVRRADSEADLRAWYSLYLETMRLHAVPPRPYRLFTAMRELMEPVGLSRLLLAERSGRLLAGSLFLTLGNTVFYAFNGSQREALAMRPNDALIWKAIHGAARDGYSTFDLGEVPEHHAQLADFKRKWGANVVRLHRYYYPPPASDVRSKGDVAGVAASAWRRLPLKLTALLGDRIYAYL